MFDWYAYSSSYVLKRVVCMHFGPGHSSPGLGHSSFPFNTQHLHKSLLSRKLQVYVLCSSTPVGVLTISQPCLTSSASVDLCKSWNKCWVKHKELLIEIVWNQVQRYKDISIASSLSFRLVSVSNPFISLHPAMLLAVFACCPFLT